MFIGTPSVPKDDFGLSLFNVLLIVASPMLWNLKLGPVNVFTFVLCVLGPEKRLPTGWVKLGN